MIFCTYFAVAKNAPCLPNYCHDCRGIRGHTETETGRTRDRSIVPKRLVIVEQPLRKRFIMTFLNILKSFKNDEAGAVTVDWVVLTAAIVGLGLVVMNTVGGGVTALSTDIAADIIAVNPSYD